MATYLLTWNSAKGQWILGLEDSIAKIKEQGYFDEEWSCGNTKRIGRGDRVFLIKLGQAPRGIMASGKVLSPEVWKGPHWDEEKKAKGKTALWVNVRFDTILDHNVNIFPMEILKNATYEKMNWYSASSGITIPDEIAIKLEEDWAAFLNEITPKKELIFAEEADINLTFLEGAKKQVTVNYYERSAEARTICIREYGVNCSVCGFNFEKSYGEIGASYIHVHHLIPLSDIKNDYKLNAIKDLRPVCPNCHAIIHQRKPAFTIDEIKELMKKALENRED